MATILGQTLTAGEPLDLITALTLTDGSYTLQNVGGTFVSFRTIDTGGDEPETSDPHFVLAPREFLTVTVASTTEDIYVWSSFEDGYIAISSQS